MTATIHRALSAIGGVLTAVSGVLVATDPSGLGVDAQTWGWVVFVIGIAVTATTAARQAFEQ